MEHKPPEGQTAGETGMKAISIALNAVPYVGGVLSSIVNEVIAQRQNRRTEQFLLQLAADLQKIADRLDNQFMHSEDFENLVEDLFEKAAATRQQEKLDALRAIFLNTVLSNCPSYDEAAEVAAQVDRWQPRHLIILKILANPKATDVAMGNVVGNGGGITTSIGHILHRLLPDWDDEQIERTWQELYDTKVHRTGGTKVMMTDRGIAQLENRLTDFGQKVVRYLSNPVE